MVLIAYQSDLYKEFVLPNTDNSDFTILLEKSIFRFKEDIKLHVEAEKSRMIIHSTPDIRIKKGGAVMEECVIESGDILSFKTKNGERFNGIIAKTSRSLEVLRKLDISSTEYISIGQDKDNIISYDFNDLVSKFHCEIRRKGNEHYIYDKSKNGIFLNSHRIENAHRMSFGDVYNIFGLHIVYLGTILGIASNYGELSVNEEYLRDYVDNSPKRERSSIGGKAKETYFSRSPRIIYPLITEPIDIEEPPNPKFSKKKPVLYTIGPAFTMAIPMLLGSGMAIVSSQMMGHSSSAFMFTGIITAVGSAVIGVIWALLNLRYAKQSEAEEEQERFNAYGNYLMEQVSKIQSSYSANTDAMNRMYPSANQCAAYDVNTPLLWSRNRTHKDFLFCRLGIGDEPFQVKINIPRKKFNIVQDNLREKPSVIKEEYSTLKNVPVGIDMAKTRLFGIVGGKDKSGAMGILYNIVAQVAANNCYTDVKMIFVYDEKNTQDRELWEFARWLPHVWSEDRKTRYLATNKLEASDIFYELANIMRMRSEEQETGEKRDKNSVRKPYYLLFVRDPELLEGQLISKYVFDPREEYGLTSFIMGDVYTSLPNECVNIIQWDQYYSGIFDASNADMTKKDIAFDVTNKYEVLSLAKRLSEVKVNEIESILDIPQSIDFFEMYGVNSLSELEVSDRWRKNRTFNTMKALIGKKAGGDNCYLDVHEKFHGPHGLVAGTTGSGKSEVLQTFILSLAINFSPEDVGFFVIDYKGGGMANLFADLPHMIGQISNLSGNQIRRAMISIKSENRRRQRLFNEAGVNNINLYTRLYKNHEVSVPVPHLFIIIDEFAELKKEEPDFMRELISVAQVGRSLGVHLILATQKPSGTVDDNIWSNSKFRLCLRVQDRQDSNDMLHKPDAAYISQAGRAYLQVGNDEIYELFQSGWSGAAYNENSAMSKSEIAKMILNTGKTAIVGSRHHMKAKERERFEWFAKIAGCASLALNKLGYESVRSLKESDRSDKLEAAEYIIGVMNENGLEYSDTASNRNAVVNFIELWPEGEGSILQVVREIWNKAHNSGVKLPEKKEKTQLDGVVSYLKKVAEDEGYSYNLKLWLPVLPEKLYLDDIKLFADTKDNSMIPGSSPVEKWDLSCVVGMYDDPENQAQLPLTVDFASNGHHAICGMVVSGKSTFLQTLLYSLICKYTPERLNLYILDFSSHLLAPFEKAPHCGGVIFDQETDKLSKFICMLEGEMNRRKALFGGGDFVQYVKSTKKEIPAWVIAVDNYGSFREKTGNAYDDVMLRVAKEGIGYGIFLVVTAGGFGLSEIPGRVGDNMRTVLSLEMGDKFKYMDVMRTSKINTLPEVGVKGRGLANVDGSLLEFHTALAVKAEDDFAKTKLLTQRCEEFAKRWTGAVARRIPEIPSPFTGDVLRTYDGYESTVKEGRVLPFALCENDASLYGIELSRTYCYAVSGKGRTGKTNVLKLLMRSAFDMGGRISVFEKGIQELRKITERCGGEYLSDDRELFGFWSGIKSEFVRRNQIKRELINEGHGEDEIYERMREEEPIFLFIADMASFMESVYKPAAGVGEMKGFVENVMEKGFLHNIFIVACIDNDNVNIASTYQAYKSFAGYKTGVHLGGNVNAQRIFTFQNIPFAEQSKVMKKGIGLVPSKDDYTASERVVIPVV